MRQRAASKRRVKALSKAKSVKLYSKKHRSECCVKASHQSVASKRGVKALLKALPCSKHCSKHCVAQSIAQSIAQSVASKHSIKG
jgi:hypothetical protein